MYSEFWIEKKIKMKYYIGIIVISSERKKEIQLIVYPSYNRNR